MNRKALGLSVATLVAACGTVQPHTKYEVPAIAEKRMEEKVRIYEVDGQRYVEQSRCEYVRQPLGLMQKANEQ